MANTFKIPIINPFRFVNLNDYNTRDVRYNTLPIDLELDDQNPNGYYSQKWQKNDVTKIQLDSDFNDVEFKIYNFCDDTFYKDIAIAPVAVAIVGQSWKVWEAEIAFDDWNEGTYYGAITYIDQNDTLQTWITSPLEVKEKHFKTLLYEYFNTQNDKGIVFDTGIKMSFRVEGIIREFTPKSSTEEYVDQKYDVYSLDDIPYGTHNNYIGSARGLPDWVIKKMNTIFTVNSVKIDGQLFNKVPGQQFEMTRPQNGPNEQGWASIQIIENFNGDQEQYVTGATPNTDFVVIQKQIPFYDNAANIAIVGVFKTHMNLIGLAIINKGLAEFTINVGLTNGGNEIGTYPVSDVATSFIIIGRVFKVAEIVYITGLAGTDTDINVDYKDYDAPQSNPNINPGGFVPNVEYTYYETNIGDFDRDWNEATGQGNVDTDFENCFLLDGQNGTIDDAGLLRIGWDKTIPGLRQTVIGAIDNFLILTRAVLPAIGLKMFADQINNTDSDFPDGDDSVALQNGESISRKNYSILRGTISPTRGATENLGDGDPLDITPMSLVVARFIYKRPE